jgi:hypothetical protein
MIAIRVLMIEIGVLTAANKAYLILIRLTWAPRGSRRRVRRSIRKRSASEASTSTPETSNRNRAAVVRRDSRARLGTLTGLGARRRACLALRTLAAQCSSQVHNEEDTLR